MALDPIYTLPQVVLLIALAVAAAVWLYRRSVANARSGTGNSMCPTMVRSIAAIRVVLVALLAALLLNPVAVSSSHSSTKPPLLILMDGSKSMSISDVEGRSRLAAATSATLEDPDLMRRLRAQYDCRLLRIGDAAIPQEIDAFVKTAHADEMHTRIGESIQSSLSSVQNAYSGGVLLISDGRNNGDADPIAAAHNAKLRRFPIFTLCLGDTKLSPDVSIINHKPQVFAVPQQRVSLGVDVKSIGYAGKTAQVDLILGNKTLQTKSVVLDDHHVVPVGFDVQQDAKGSYRYTFSVRPMPQEQTTSNNSSSVLVEVLKSKARVLVLEGRPSWDAKFLIKALRTDPSISVDAIFKVTPIKFFAMMGTQQIDSQSAGRLKIPKTAAELSAYDVIIIGKGYESFFDAQDTEALRSFVADHAGKLIFLRGRPDERTEALRTLEPIQWSTEQINDIRMQLTEEGERNPAFTFDASQGTADAIQKLPNMVSATRVVGEKALAVVLARAAGVPSADAAPGTDKEMAVVAYQNYGQGRVLSLVGEGLWRWALLPPELKDYTACYSEFWTQMVRWMVNQSDFLPGQDVSLKTDRANYAIGEGVTLMAFVRGKAQTSLPPVAIAEPSGKSEHVTLGKGGAQADYVGTFRPDGPGEYIATLDRAKGGSLVVPFSVNSVSDEDLVTAADPTLMNQIAHESGGEALTIANVHDFPDKLKQARSTLTEKTASRSTWDRGWVLAFILALLTGEWILRRRNGMV